MPFHCFGIATVNISVGSAFLEFPISELLLGFATEVGVVIYYWNCFGTLATQMFRVVSSDETL
eukprot:5935589-Amphidinium_carterae.1